MHPPETKETALALIAAGHNDCEVARKLAVARTTVRDWRRPRYVGSPRESCWRCWGRTKPIRLTLDDYAELLGLYLGDGCISEHARTCCLRIALDAKYPTIVADCERLLARVFPENPVGKVEAHHGSMYSVTVYSSHLPCVLPQHGRGPKHMRRIVLESWQRESLERAPWAFIRACIRTDGCVFVNRTGPYEYLSYDFSNKSSDIAELFVAACRRVGVECRLTKSNGIYRVRVNRRGSVAMLRRRVGMKC